MFKSLLGWGFVALVAVWLKYDRGKAWLLERTATVRSYGRAAALVCTEFLVQLPNGLRSLLPTQDAWVSVVERGNFRQLCRAILRGYKEN